MSKVAINWTNTKRAINILMIFLYTILCVYVSLTPFLSSLINSSILSPNSRIITKFPSLKYSVSLARPVSPPVFPVVYVKDIYEGDYQIPHPEICPSQGVHLKVLILITSAPDHVGPRNAIRLTWGHFSRRSDLAFAFVLGSPPNNIKQSLIEEDVLYRDLIIGNNLDSYNNLSLKTISMLEWASTYCPRVPYLLKTDDDVFINIPLLLDFLQRPSVVNASKVIWGKKIRNLSPIRLKWQQHYLPFSQFRGRVVPDYCNGPAYLMTGDCILPLLKAAPEEIYLRLEDVFVTGILARKVGIKRQHAAWFLNYYIYSPCHIWWGISIHPILPNEQFEFWRKLLDNRISCRTLARIRPALAHSQKVPVN